MTRKTLSWAGTFALALMVTTWLVIAYFAMFGGVK